MNLGDTSIPLAPASSSEVQWALEQAMRLGGPPLQREIAWAATTYGAPVAVAWITALSADPRTRDIYVERKRLADVVQTGRSLTGQAHNVPLGGEAEESAKRVHALERQVLAAVLRKLQPADKTPQGSVRRAVAVGKSTPVPENIGFRDVAGAGGYTYRQYADGTLVLLRSPRGGEGKTVDPRSAAGRAIVEEIGAFPVDGASTPEGVMRALRAANQVADMLPPGRGGRPGAGDVVKIGVSAAGTAVAAAPVVAGLLTAAGVSAATVPVAGWIVGGGLAIAGATVALVNLFRKKRPRKDIDAHVKRHGFAKDTPDLVERFARMSSADRDRLGQRLAAHLRSGRARDPRRVEERLRVLAAVELAQRAKARGQAHALDRFESQVQGLMGMGDALTAQQAAVQALTAAMAARQRVPVEGLGGPLEGPRHAGPRGPRGGMRPPGMRLGPWYGRAGFRPVSPYAPVLIAPVVLPCASAAVRDALLEELRTRGVPVVSVTCRQGADGAQTLIAHVPDDTALNLRETSFRGWRVIYAFDAPARSAAARFRLPSMAPDYAAVSGGVHTMVAPMAAPATMEVTLGRLPFVLG